MRIKFLPLILILFIFKSEVHSQSPFQKYFITTGGDKVNVEITNDGGFVVLGRSIVRTNSAGNIVWSKSYDFGLFNITSAQKTFDGGFVISGSRTTVSNNSDFYLVKTDSSGNVLWSKSYGDSLSDEAFCMTQTSDSGFVIAGRIFNNNHGNVYDMYVIKVDKTGHLLWTKILRITDDYEIVTSIQETKDSGIVMTGNVISQFFSGNIAFIMKLDRNGNVMWTRIYNGPGNEGPNCIKQTMDGGYIVTGLTTNAFNAIYNMFLIKVDSMGIFSWSRYFVSNKCIGNYLEQTPDSGFIVVGQVVSDTINDSNFLLIKTNANGDTLWTKTYGGPGIDDAFSLKQTNDGGYVVVGTSNSFGSGYYMLKTDSLGITGNPGNKDCNNLSSTISVYTDTIYEVNVTNLSDSLGSENSFTANVSSGLTEVSLCSPVNTENNIGENLFEIFPNPTTGKFNIISESIINGFLEVIDLNGRCVYKNIISNSTQSFIDLTEISKGIYFIRISDGSNFFIKKLILD